MAYKQASASRAVNELLRIHRHPPLTRQCLPAGTEVWIYYDTPKQNKRTAWVEGKVVEAHEHYFTYRSNVRGQPMKVLYEDLILVPQGELTMKL